MRVRVRVRVRVSTATSECAVTMELHPSWCFHSLIRAMAPRYGLDGVVPCSSALVRRW